MWKSRLTAGGSLIKREIFIEESRMEERDCVDKSHTDGGRGTFYKKRSPEREGSVKWRAAMRRESLTGMFSEKEPTWEDDFNLKTACSHVKTPS